MLSKSQIFYFFISFLVTFVIGFFAWNMFVKPENGIFDKVLGQVNQLGSKLFSASLSDSYVLPIDLSLPEPVEQELEPEEDEEIVVATGIDVAMTDQQRQDLLDDIQEKLDIIGQQIQELIEAQTPQDEVVEEIEDVELAEDIEEENEEGLELQEDSCFGQININTASAEDLDKLTQVGPVTAQKIIEARPFYSLNDLLNVSGIGQATLQKITEQGCAYVEATLAPPVLGGGGGGGGDGSNVCSTTPGKNILINEIQIEGETVNDDWVELYNPNDEAVCLNDWSIQKASSMGSISHVKNFSTGAKILGKSYYLIVRNNANQGLLGLADMTCSGLELSSEFGSGNTVYIVKKQAIIADGNNTDIVDKVGYGTAKDYKVLPALRPEPGQNTQSIGRIWDETSQDYKNTNNNNADFEIDAPTPKTQNTVFVPSDTTVPPASSDATVTSTIYTVSPIVNGAGTLTNVSFGTSKAAFLNNLIFAIGAIENITSSSLSDSIASNDTLVVIAQDGTTTTTYTITVNPIVILPTITSYTFNGIAQNITVNPVINPVQINLVAGENVNWMYVRVVNVSDPTIYKSFGSGVGCVDNTMSCNKIWDGSISHGTALIDGNYQIKVHIKNATNNEFEDYVAPYTITVDTVVLPPVLSSDATITSTIYAVSSLVSGAGTISNIPFGTSKANFEAGLAKNQADQIWDDSGITDPVASGNILVVTAQDGTTTASYAVTVNPVVVFPMVTSYTFNGVAQDVSFNPFTPSSVSIVINMSEPVKFNRIYICLNSVATCDGSHYIKYFTQTTSYALTVSKSWNGKTSGGDYAPDGIYEIGVQVIDELGSNVNLTLAPYTITVNTTTP